MLEIYTINYYDGLLDFLGYDDGRWWLCQFLGPEGEMYPDDDGPGRKYTCVSVADDGTVLTKTIYEEEVRRCKTTDTSSLFRDN